MKTLSIIFGLMMAFTTTYATGTTPNSYELLEEELFINDIPFNTGDLAVNYLYHEALNVDFALEDENYIDDIPFDTACISADCHYQKAIQIVFEMPEEETIYDIPTHLI